MVTSTIMSLTLLFDIPEEVFPTNLFQFLRLNDLLRLRRVCHRAKGLSEEYLRGHPRSPLQLQFKLVTGDIPSNHSSCVDNFLEEDNSSTIPKPISKVRLYYDDNDYSKVLESSSTQLFLQRYGSQVQHLTVSYMSLPMTSSEIKFYEKFPKLKSLIVNHLHIISGTETQNIVFPESFVNLRKLSLTTKTVRDSSVCKAELSVSAKFFEFCRDLGYFHFFEPRELVDTLIQDLTQVLRQDNHKKFRFVDIDNYCQQNLPVRVLPQFGQMLHESNLKLLKLDYRLLLTFDKSFLQQIAPRVVSVKTVFFENLPGRELDDDIVFDNVEKLQIYILRDRRKRSLAKSFEVPPEDQQLNLMRRVLTHRTFPTLTKLEICYAGCCLNIAEMLSGTWASFPNLEEVRFPNGAPDVAFLGSGGDCPFLQLSKLRTLSIGIGDWMAFWAGVVVSDVSFKEVFRHMKLREFRLTGEPLIGITSTGIRSLLGGPFCEAIEVFPFQGWTLCDLSQEEFQELSREFPCNKDL